ncbi:hypothetical protein LOAG_01099 [Loa loa]|uniref:C2H2-type domain-containing protein n=1 Tax=Loa loa TaxID=7209 RepID=A0A1S0UBT1_LOALO|nr:hypothetical protein LOAG_01099 [Loa loa]EFO27388.2 hypothetical protein LOAG_01099 [Loa loa]
MSSLKALLSSKSFDSVTTSNLEMTSNNGRKRGAALEEWLLRKFPELYRKSHDLESTTVPANDVENQPLNLVKRCRRDVEVKNEAPIVYTGCTGHLYPKTLRTNSYNRVSVQRSNSKHDIISSEYYVLPKGDPFTLKNEHLSRRVDNDLEWNDGENKTQPVSNNEGKHVNKDDTRNSNSTTRDGRYRNVNRLQNNNKRIDGSIYSFAANKQIAKRLTTPKLTKHNDAAYYPNIQCLLCREWVCSRNRYMHVESHLQYRPYKCSFCGYDNRKEIFIILHIKKVHGGRAEVIRDINTELEHEAWNIAERCVEHTRDVLQRAHQEAIQHDKASTSTEPGNSTKVEEALLSKYSTQYRPRLYNTQRAEKSLVIEDSLKMGILPDFSEVSNREVKCQVRLCRNVKLKTFSINKEEASERV